MTKVSIVVLNWNRKEDTLFCLKSIEKLVIKGIDLEIIVVDNGSTDGSVDSLMKYKPRQAKYKLIEKNENIGFTGGNNEGIRYALDHGSDYVMVLNNDTEVDKSLLINLLTVASEDTSIGAISPKIYFAKGYEYHNKYKKSELGEVIWYAGGDIDWNNVYGANHGVDSVDKGQFDTTEETDFVTGACTFFNAQALKQVGFYDNKYFMYLEDSDLSQRMKKHGWRVLYSSKAKLWHKVAQSSKIGGDLNDYFITRNRLLFGLRYAALNTKLALIRESIVMIVRGRKWQKTGVKDYYLRRYGKGSWIK